MNIKSVAELWEALEHKFSTSDVGHELYVMEQYHDFRMVDNRSIVEQAHEFQLIVRELEQLRHVLPDKFVAGGIIAKLPSTWRNFAIALKHKRQKISIEDLLAGLDVEEKARAKDAPPTAPKGQSSANMTQQTRKKNQKGKGKAAQTTQFKKKKMNICFICGHFAKKCKNRKGKKNQPGQKSANVTIRNPNGGSRYGNLPSIFSTCQSNDWWIDIGVNIHVCTDISTFSSYQVT